MMTDNEFKRYIELLMSMCVDVLQKKITRETFVSNLRFFLEGMTEQQDEWKPPDKDIVEDGFGSCWSAWCPMCRKKTMQVVRPGKVQCGYCG